MSRQLALSAAFSIFAMAAFAIFATVKDSGYAGEGASGAPMNVEAPVDLSRLPRLPSLPVLID